MRRSLYQWVTSTWFSDYSDQQSCNLKDLKACLVKALDVCNAAISQLRRDRVCYICLIVIFSTFLSLISLFDHHLPFSTILRSYNIVPVIITLILVFCSLMAFLWNSMEYNGVLCGQSTMQIALRRTLELRSSQKRGEGGTGDEYVSEGEYTDWALTRYRLPSLERMLEGKQNIVKKKDRTRILNCTLLYTSKRSTPYESGSNRDRDCSHLLAKRLYVHSPRYCGRIDFVLYTSTYSTLGTLSLHTSVM